MRIERHRIGAKRLREATEDFAGRIGRSVRLQQEAGRDGFGWQMIANDLLDYAGARSVEDPQIDRDAWMALGSAADLIGTPGTDAERALHALATGDQDAFWTAIAAMLAQPLGENPRPRTLLPSAPLALTAIAVRDNGWEQRIESDYLPPSITRSERGHGAETSIEPEDLSNYEWHHAIALALITGSKERRGLLLGIDPDALASEWSAPAHHAYHVALRAYLRGEPARPAMDRALAAVRNAAAAQPGILWPFTVLLSQLVAGDRDGFVAALVDALEEFREHYTAGDEQDSVSKQVPIDILALTCHAHRELGWGIPLVSDYLPTAIVAPWPTRDH
ncbi:hypothetical protein BKA00_003119 [Actinomadura coerulea]|uniref:Immunity 49 family protein n=1 Tax=Actinomadura coerulea TaxID=46159 RepID=A0A7X0G009_9ACTN|nr:immunity 49 family protein [Actinomadura coerulea]MBB6396205.1 hypothetical protein [Actinomadura coerulea]